MRDVGQRTGAEAEASALLWGIVVFQALPDVSNPACRRCGEFLELVGRHQDHGRESYGARRLPELERDPADRPGLELAVRGQERFDQVSVEDDAWQDDAPVRSLAVREDEAVPCHSARVGD